MTAGFHLAPATQVHTAGPHLAFTELRCQLTVMSGPQAGRSVEVELSPAKASFVVGKGDECDLTITDPTVSQKHFVIEQQAGAYVIRDHASTNGTFIDQFRIREAYLRPGVFIRAGGVQLKFEPLFKPIAIAPSPADAFGRLTRIARSAMASPARPFVVEPTAPLAIDLGADDAVPLVVDCTLPFKEAKEKLLEQFEGEYFRRLIARSAGNASAIARSAGIDRKHVYTLAKKHGLDLKGRREPDDA